MTRGLTDVLTEWLPKQRWFGALSHTVTGVEIRSRAVLGESPGLRVEHLLIATRFRDAPEQTFQVPLAWRSLPRPELAAAALDDDHPLEPEQLIAYDALRDPTAITVLADAFAHRSSFGQLAFHTEMGTMVPAGLAGRALNAEQSNTSVVLAERLLLKIFRRVSPGLNPDLELHRALFAGDCAYIAPVRAWFDGTIAGEPSTLGMMQDFAANTADGWQMALTSVRDLFAEADLNPEDVGTDFADEAQRIGVALAYVHRALAQQLGTETLFVSDSAVPAMVGRLEAASAMIGELSEYAEGAREVFLAAQHSEQHPTVQRVHGDLHLGQLLRTPIRWLMIDFEGEPAKSLVDRRRPDSVLRDVAGMLRSFDYAAFHQLHDGDPTGPRTQLEFRARQWAQRNIGAFCDGYTAVSGLDPRAQPELLRAYELDKAVYEAGYEAQHRPTWLEIPLRAIRRLTSAAEGPRGQPHRTEQDRA